MRRRHRLTTLLATGIVLSSTQALALDSGRFAGQFGNLLNKAFTELLRIISIPSVRQGLSLIFLVVLLYKLFQTALNFIPLFKNNENSGTGVNLISISLALLSTFAIYRKITPDVLENLFLMLGLSALLIFIISWIIKFMRKFGTSTNYSRTVRDERQVRHLQNQEEHSASRVEDIVHNIHDNMKHKKSLEKDKEERLDDMEHNARNAVESLDDLQHIKDKSRRAGGGV